MTTSMDARVLAVLRTYGHTKSQLDKILRGLHSDAGMHDLGAILDRLVVEKKIKVSNRPGDEGGYPSRSISRLGRNRAANFPCVESNCLSTIRATFLGGRSSRSSQAPWRPPND